MVSFRAEEPDAAAQMWAERLGLDNSDLLHEALHRHLVRLEGERDAETWQQHPLTASEQALDEIEGWRPAPRMYRARGFSAPPPAADPARPLNLLAQANRPGGVAPG
jgi:hypothetical protein